MKNSFKSLVPIAVSLLVFSCDSTNYKAENAGKANYEKTDSGVLVKLDKENAKAVRLDVYTDSIMRVTVSPTGKFTLPESLMVVAEPGKDVDFEVKEEAGDLLVKAKNISAEIDLESGIATFFDADGGKILQEVDRGEFSTVTADPAKPDADSFALRQEFNRGVEENLYGLGQHQHGYVNLSGKNVDLTTYNMIISIPFLVSNKNYGILWDNNSETRFGDPERAKPINQDLKLYDAEGKPGGITARYYDGDKLKLTRVETDIDYRFLSHLNIRENPFPDEVKDLENLRVEWEGAIEAKTEGEHELRMYSSEYAKLYLDDELVLDRWRMNWNPWYHNVQKTMKPGQKHKLKIEWSVGGGYLGLHHRDPLPAEELKQISFASDTGKAIDYYVVAGDDMDEVISGYRKLTGKSVMLPRWAYGFWQSRERYKSQDELLGALKGYRDRKIPIDNIVLDWSYWPVDAWGSHDFDPEFFPDPKGLVDKVHEMNAQIMISVWPKFYPTTDNYKELNDKGYMLNRNIEDGNLDWIGEGYLNGFYDAFAPEGREIFWRQIRDKINVHGFDAWWLDAVEPDMHSNVSWEKRKEFMTPNHLGSGAEYFNAYALPHAETVYQRDRETDDKRVFILTRSGFAGIQRTGSAIWSGDIVSRWSNLKEQIASGIGTAMAGMPNWTFDIGGFTPENRFRQNSTDKPFVGPYTQLDKDQVEEWQELNTRWYQFGAFIPLFRAHGQNPYREIFNIAAESSEAYESMVWYTKLRYRLLPYIYSQAGDMYHKDATLMRGLAMDFPSDQLAASVNDQFMFGPALLVNPVYEYKARERSVYLPEGVSWYNFYNGEVVEGGQRIEANAPFDRMPLFVKAGSIIPTGPEIQYSDEIINADITLNVYTGASGEFELYEDDGRSYDYEKGEYSRIPVSYDDAKGVLTIGERSGSFKGMSKTRKVNVRWISGKVNGADDFDRNIAETATYEGKAIVLKRK